MREGQLAAMQAELARIPHDAVGSWRSGPLGLVAATLHTTAESREQAQPLASEDGQRAAVFDGYLLNPAELVRDLEAGGARLRTRSDIEIALRAYELWGQGCAERLRGEYSLIVADARAGRLFVTRDHLGFVPLYYLEQPGQLVLASDFRTIAALGQRALEPDPLYLAHVMANRWVTGERTP